MPVSDEHKARVLAHIERQSERPAMIRATFSEWRMVKGRKVLQIICEVPLEAQSDVWQALGSPMPDSEIWVAIARLRDGSAPQAKPPVKFVSLAQQAGILCNEVPFRRWLAETGGFDGIAVLDLDTAADELRRRCGVASRRDLDTDAEAGERFRGLRADYTLWLEDVDA